MVRIAFVALVILAIGWLGCPLISFAQQQPTSFESEYLRVSRDLATATWALVGWTAGLVGVGIMVGLLQMWLLLGSLQAARDAADAARDANTKLERPWVMVFVENPQAPKPDPIATMLALGQTDTETGAVVDFHVVNNGRSPAWVTSIASNVEVFRTGSLPPVPPDRPARPAHRLPLPTSRPHGEVTWGVIEPSDWNAVVEGLAEVRFHGYVEYRDAFGETHRSRFCWRWWRDPAPDGRLILFGPGGPAAWSEST